MLSARSYSAWGRGGSSAAVDADADGARARERLREEGSASGVSDEELRRAILAALIKHDNPRVGVGRKKGFLGVGRGKR